VGLFVVVSIGDWLVVQFMIKVAQIRFALNL
jgi:hypothetical protein